MALPNGDQDQPQYELDDEADFAAHLSQVSNYAALVGNLKRLTTNARTALAGKKLWQGLHVYDLDLKGLVVRRDAIWVNAGSRIWMFERAGTSDTFPASASALTGLVTLNISDAPKGVYKLDNTLVLSGSQAATGFWRVIAGPAGSEAQVSRILRCDVTPAPAFYNYGTKFVWNGGDLRITIEARVAAGTATVQSAGTVITATYLGPIDA
jgi:hypothetical protein